MELCTESNSYRDTGRYVSAVLQNYHAYLTLYGEVPPKGPPCRDFRVADSSQPVLQERRSDVPYHAPIRLRVRCQSSIDWSG